MIREPDTNDVRDILHLSKASGVPRCLEGLQHDGFVRFSDRVEPDCLGWIVAVALGDLAGVDDDIAELIHP